MMLSLVNSFVPFFFILVKLNESSTREIISVMSLLLV